MEDKIKGIRKFCVKKLMSFPKTVSYQERDMIICELFIQYTNSLRLTSVINKKCVHGN